jgi:hypothetical protein
MLETRWGGFDLTTEKIKKGSNISPDTVVGSDGSSGAGDSGSGSGYSSSATGTPDASVISGSTMVGTCIISCSPTVRGSAGCAGVGTSADFSAFSGLNLMGGSFERLSNE